MSLSRNPIPSFGLTALLSLAAGSLLFFSPLVNPVAAQSTNRNSPTPLTSNTVSGMGIYAQNQTYFYSFVAGPGQLDLTLDLDAGSTNGNGVTTTISLQDRQGGVIISLDGFATPGMPGRTVKSVKFVKPTPVVMMVTLPGGTTASYNYSLQLSGPLQLAGSQAGSQPSATCIQPGGRGVVRFQLSNGLVQEIDLSQVQQITVK